MNSTMACSSDCGSLSFTSAMAKMNVIPSLLCVELVAILPWLGSRTAALETSDSMHTKVTAVIVRLLDIV